MILFQSKILSSMFNQTHKLALRCDAGEEVRQYLVGPPGPPGAPGIPGLNPQEVAGRVLSLMNGTFS